MRKSFFDDYVFYCPKKNKLFVGRPDVKWGDKPWTWFLTDGEKAQYPNDKPRDLVEIGREPEMSMFQ